MVERPRKLVRQIKRKFGTPDADAGFLDLHRQLTDGENVAPDHPAIAGLAGLSDFIDEEGELPGRPRDGNPRFTDLPRTNHGPAADLPRGVTGTGTRLTDL